jgi:hypothetical protein
LNVPSKAQVTQSDSVKAAEAALTAKPTPAERKADVRMSTMSEKEVMTRLIDAVSKDDPNLSYAKQKKIGQGASGSVYVAKVKETAVSGVARDVLRAQGPRAQVAIKQMDLAHQPRKELIVNEIMVMKDSKHRNIVNFLDAFLRNNNAELWVVMEYMEGGALTDVIDNNPVITEEQISTICLEVSLGCSGRDRSNWLTVRRLAKDCNTCTRSRSSTVISRVTMSFLMLAATSRLVSNSRPANTTLGLLTQVQPILVSAPSSPRPSRSVLQWLVPLTGWLPRLSSKRSMAQRLISGHWESWLLR